jgi:hypothetical protein
VKSNWETKRDEIAWLTNNSIEKKKNLQNQPHLAVAGVHFKLHKFLLTIFIVVGCYFILKNFVVG